jgi:hypothetical protein
MTARFADSFYFLALLNPGDAAHTAASRAMKEVRRPLVTTAWVLTEVADAMAAPANCPLFLRLIAGFHGQRSVGGAHPTNFCAGSSAIDNDQLAACGLASGFISSSSLSTTLLSSASLSSQLSTSLSRMIPLASMM